MCASEIMNGTKKEDQELHGGVLHRRDISSLIWKTMAWPKIKNNQILHWGGKKIYEIFGLKCFIHCKIKI